MSMFGFLSSDKKSTSTSTSTTTTQVDKSINAGGGATVVGEGGVLNVNDLSVPVAQNAIDATKEVAVSGLNTSAAVALAGIDAGTKMAALSLNNQDNQNANTLAAAQESISYARQLAELGYSTKVAADTAGAAPILDSLGKYAALAVGAVFLGLFLLKKGSK